VTRSEKRTGRSFPGPPGVFQFRQRRCQAEVLLWFSRRPTYTIRRRGRRILFADAEDFFSFPADSACQKGNHWYWKSARAYSVIPFELFLRGCRQGDYLTELTKLADHWDWKRASSGWAISPTIGNGSSMQRALAIIYPPLTKTSLCDTRGYAARKPVCGLLRLRWATRVRAPEQNGLIVEPTHRLWRKRWTGFGTSRLTAKRWNRRIMS